MESFFFLGQSLNDSKLTFDCMIKAIVEQLLWMIFIKSGFLVKKIEERDVYSCRRLHTIA